MTTAIEISHNFDQQVRLLVRQHLTLKQEPLRLAVYIPPRRVNDDIFLFEVIDGFGGDEVDPDHKLFKFGFGSTPGFPLPSGITLRMVLTSPAELKTAIRDRWKDIEELRAARQGGKAKVIHADAVGRKLWDLI